MLDLTDIGRRAKAASAELAKIPDAHKVVALQAIAAGLKAQQDAVLAANAADVAAAEANGVRPAMVERLALSPKKLAGMASDVLTVAGLPDPVGERFDERTLPNGMQIARQRVPIGVLGVIYESRPNVTIDIAALAIKTGNTVILRGGSDNLRSNLALLQVVQAALAQAGLPMDAVQLITDTDRRYVSELLKLHQYVDLIIPRGGSALHKLCRENSTIPVITGGVGICHIFVDESADLARAVPLIYNAKTQRPGACNSLDTLLVHPRVAAALLPEVVAQLGAAGVTFRADSRALALLPNQPLVQPAQAGDFDIEWMELILGLKVVDSLAEAITFINAHSLGHSDSILTNDAEHAATFLNEVDSAAVYVNASTRFTDGAQFGLGAEVAISTKRLHARGPMGLPELTTYKWVVQGDYHLRS